MPGKVRRACRWSLYYRGKWFCKLPSIRRAEPPTPLDAGCLPDCGDTDIVPWKHDLYGDDYEDGANDLPMPKVVEWDDET